MSLGDGKKKPDPVPPPGPESDSPGEGLLTSSEVFGDIVDAPPPAASRPRPPARRGPIQVQVSEPNAEGVPKREVLSEEVVRLLDVFPTLDVGEPPAAEPSPAVAAPAAVAEEEPIVIELPESLSPAVVEEFLESFSRLSAEPTARHTDPLQETGQPSFETLPRETPAEAAPPAPRPAVLPETPEEGGLDLGALAEGAMASASTGAQGAARGEAGARAQPISAREGSYGPYRLLARLAVGGMAEVFKAKRSGVEGFEKVLAVKRILPHLSANKQFVEMFVDEAKIVSGLAHPNIVQIHDLGRIEKSYYIAMEYVHGRDLRSILRRARERGLRLPMDLSILIVSKVCSALEYAHRKKDDRGQNLMIAHRDISPQNILISFEGDVKLTDFGIAKAAVKATQTDRGSLRGKLLYMSPEQASGKPMDRRSDLFSLGVVFYEMLTEQKPFLGTSESNILDLVRECRVQAPSALNPRIPEKLEAVVMKALERDPELRYQDASEMYRDLDRILHQRKPPTAVKLARFMEVLFDEGERADILPAEVEAGRHRGEVNGDMEIEFETPPEEPSPEASAEVRGIQDPMSIQKLLKRFGIK